LVNAATAAVPAVPARMNARRVMVLAIGLVFCMSLPCAILGCPPRIVM
jgi:hypothetical protein